MVNQRGKHFALLYRLAREFSTLGAPRPQAAHRSVRAESLQLSTPKVPVKSCLAILRSSVVLVQRLGLWGLSNMDMAGGAVTQMDNEWMDGSWTCETASGADCHVSERVWDSGFCTDSELWSMDCGCLLGLRRIAYNHRPSRGSRAFSCQHDHRGHVLDRSGSQYRCRRRYLFLQRSSLLCRMLSLPLLGLGGAVSSAS